jgi:4,5-dihydroxyphthalate decarboxylase
MAKATLTLACAEYDRTRTLIDGRVRSDSFDLDIRAMRPREAFQRMLDDGEFDACEMSLASHAILKAKGDTRFVGIPAMLSKMFRHNGMYIRSGAGIQTPQDLVGKRVGTNRYNSTGLTYMRGLLQDEYRVPSGAIRWCIGPLNDPNEKPQMPSGATAYDATRKGATLEAMLESGEIDAIFSNDMPRLFLNGSKQIARLFLNFKDVERDYYRRTGIFPVMHILVLREDVHRAYPNAAISLYRAFCGAKDIAADTAYDSDALHLSLPFLLDHIEEARRDIGTDFWAYGLEPNRPALEALGRYICEQGLAPRAVMPEELFLPGL